MVEPQRREVTNRRCRHSLFVNRRSGAIFLGMQLRRGCPMKYSVGIVFTVLAVVFAPLTVQALDFQSCNNCHGEALNADNSRMFIHSPFGKQQCDQCHAAASIVSAQQASVTTEKSLSTVPQKQGSINWLGDSVMTDTSHSFLLPSDKVGDTLVVDVQGTEGKISRREIAVPLLKNLAEVQDSGQPPTISDVKVLKVERGVFLSATIGWQTDTLTKGLVRYNCQGSSQTSKPSNRFGKRHEVVLYGLKVDQTYQFSVVSTDLFGRSKTFNPMEFSTSGPYLAPLPNNSVAQPEQEHGGEIGMTDRFERLGSSYLIGLIFDQPAAVYVGSSGAIRQQSVTVENITPKAPPANNTAANITTTAASEEDAAHVGLSSEDVSAMEACRPCHENQDTATHPVNVYPKPGMTIPPEYPTLPDGRITCSTCHKPHSSDYRYLTRKQSKRELCIGCHKDMI